MTTCKHCPEPIEGCPVGDYCWCNGYVHQGAGHKCARAFQPQDGWPLANLAEPDWDKVFPPWRPDVSLALAEHTAHALNTLSGGAS